MLARANGERWLGIEVRHFALPSTLEASGRSLRPLSSSGSRHSVGISCGGSLESYGAVGHKRSVCLGRSDCVALCTNGSDLEGRCLRDSTRGVGGRVVARQQDGTAYQDEDQEEQEPDGSRTSPNKAITPPRPKP